MAAHLSNISVEELRAELARRTGEVEPWKVAPPPIANPNFTELVALVTSGVAEIAREGRENDDFKHYVYMAAIVAIYGEGYWAWHRSRIR